MKNKINLLMSLLMCTLMYTAGYAQEKTVTGIVTDQSNLPVPGVNVLVKGTQKGVSTDFDGKYGISAAPGETLVFSYLGFKSKEIKVGTANSYNISLESESATLKEVVVVGYGTQKKSDVTGAMISMSAEELQSRPVNNVIEAMQGKAAGVSITSSERPGTVGKITIRGVRSLTASNSPLYVVDGIPSDGIENLNSNDIQSIDVLKDASATAIYGSRGANGVVIITTKRGKAGKFTLDLSSSLTVENLHDDSKIMNAGEYIEWRRWAKYYQNPSVYPRGDAPTKTNDELIFLKTADASAWANIEKGWTTGTTWDPSKVTTTNWTNLVTRTGVTQQYNLSASGGTEKMNGYLSFGYLNNVGTVKGQGYERYTMKASFDVTPKDWFSFGGSINASYTKNEYGQSDVGRNGNVNTTGLYATARTIFTYAVPYDSNGNRVELPGGDVAVKTVVDEEKYSQDQRVTFRTTASIYSQVDFGSISPALKGLKYRMNFGPNFNMYRDGVYLDAKSAVRTGSSFASLRKDQTFNYTLDNLLYYDKAIGKHSFGLTLLQSQSEDHYETNSMSANGIPFASQKWNALSSANVTLSDWNSDIINKQLLSYMIRLNYNYDGKYLLTLSGRRDGASQLAPGHKSSDFSSAALGWRLDREEFLDNNSWIDQLKLRLGVGVTGNAAIDPYSTKGPLTTSFYPFGTTLTPGTSTSATLANLNLGWEKTTQYNIGVDYSFFNGRVSGVLDAYKSKTTDLLLKRELTPVTGYANTFQNIGATANKGIDFTLNTVNIKSTDFQWETNISASWQSGHITSLPNGNDIVNNWFIGQPIGVIYSYASNGIWKEKDAAEMALFNANGHTFQFGMSRPVDQNGDHKIDANNDKVFIGSTTPKYNLGLTNTFTYKNIELAIFLYGRMGYTFNSGGEGQTGRFNQRSINYYTENNKNSVYQKPIYTEATGDPYSSILGYRDGSYLKIRNISLGYNMPSELAQKIGVNNLKIYVQATNPGMLFRKVDWMDLDLETSAYNRGITTGLNVSF